MAIGVVIRLGGTDRHAAIGGIISVGEVVAETFLHASLVAIICKGPLTIKETLSGIIVGIVDDI